VKWSDVGIRGIAGTTLKARDLWAHSEIKMTGDNYLATVPGHGVLLLRVAGE
jgi:hypothetical protein